MAGRAFPWKSKDRQDWVPLESSPPRLKMKELKDRESPGPMRHSSWVSELGGLRLGGRWYPSAANGEGEGHPFAFPALCLPDQVPLSLIKIVCSR